MEPIVCEGCGKKTSGRVVANVSFESVDVSLTPEDIAVNSTGDIEIEDHAVDDLIDRASDNVGGHVDDLWVECSHCKKRFDAKQIRQFAIAEETSVAIKVQVGAVVATDQFVVRQVHEVDGDRWRDEHGEWWHGLQITHVRTPHIALFDRGAAPPVDAHLRPAEGQADLGLAA